MAVWALLAGQEEELVEVVKDISNECFSERIMEETVKTGVPREQVKQWEKAEVPEIIIVFRGPGWRRRRYAVPQIAAKIPVVVETIPHQQHVPDDLPVPQVVKENLEVIKVPHKREVVPRVPEETADLVKLVSQKRVQQQFMENFPRERITERTQIVDEPVRQLLGRFLMKILGVFHWFPTLSR